MEFEQQASAPFETALLVQRLAPHFQKPETSH